MSREQMVTHLVAGGVGGTVGAIVTCPLEVCTLCKTRLYRLRVCLFARHYLNIKI